MTQAWVRRGFAMLMLVCAGCAPRRESMGWQEVAVPTDADYRGVWFTDSLNGWITGGGREIEGGIVARTHDGGHEWQIWTGVLPSLQAGHGLYRAVFRDTSRGWAVADGGDVLHTSDGGHTWAVLNSGMAGGELLTDLRVMGDAIWAAGPSRVLHSGDAGATWALLSANTAENGYRSVTAVQFLEPSRGWLTTRSGELLRTWDGGAQWQPVNVPVQRSAPTAALPALRDLYFVDERHGWVVGDQGVILYTSDGGSSWQRQSEGVPVVRLGPDGKPAVIRDVVPELDSPAEPLLLSCVRFADPQRGWAVGYYLNAAESLVLGTRDGGAHWAIEHRMEGELLGALDVLDARHAWAAGVRARSAPQRILRLGLPEPKRD